MIVISDTGPLISLMKAERLNVLQQLYQDILIPEAVFTELTTNDRYQDEADCIRNSTFIHIVTVADRNAVELLRRVTGLDLGESEAIIYADSHKNSILLMEEEAGRRVAARMDIHVRGSIGILLYAFDKGLLTADDVILAMNKMQIANRRISKELYQMASDYVTQ